MLNRTAEVQKRKKAAEEIISLLDSSLYDDEENDDLIKIKKAVGDMVNRTVSSNFPPEKLWLSSYVISSLGIGGPIEDTCRFTIEYLRYGRDISLLMMGDKEYTMTLIYIGPIHAPSELIWSKDSSEVTMDFDAFLKEKKHCEGVYVAPWIPCIGNTAEELKPIIDEWKENNKPQIYNICSFERKPELFTNASEVKEQAEKLSKSIQLKIEWKSPFKKSEEFSQILAPLIKKNNLQLDEKKGVLKEKVASGHLEADLMKKLQELTALHTTIQKDKNVIDQLEKIINDSNEHNYKSTTAIDPLILATCYQLLENSYRATGQINKLNNHISKIKQLSKQEDETRPESNRRELKTELAEKQEELAEAQQALAKSKTELQHTHAAHMAITQSLRKENQVATEQLARLNQKIQEDQVEYKIQLDHRDKQFLAQAEEVQMLRKQLAENTEQNKKLIGEIHANKEREKEEKNRQKQDFFKRIENYNSPAYKQERNVEKKAITLIKSEFKNKGIKFYNVVDPCLLDTTEELMLYPVRILKLQYSKAYDLRTLEDYYYCPLSQKAGEDAKMEDTYRDTELTSREPIPGNYPRFVTDHTIDNGVNEFLEKHTEKSRDQWINEARAVLYLEETLLEAKLNNCSFVLERPQSNQLIIQLNYQKKQKNLIENSFGKLVAPFKQAIEIMKIPHLQYKLKVNESSSQTIIEADPNTLNKIVDLLISSSAAYIPSISQFKSALFPPKAEEPKASSSSSSNQQLRRKSNIAGCHIQ